MKPKPRVRSKQARLTLRRQADAPAASGEHRSGRSGSANLPGVVVKPGSEVLRDAWADLLSREVWDWFATLTYRGMVRAEEKCVRDFRRWLFDLQVKRGVELGLLEVRGQTRTGHQRLGGPLYNAWRKGRHKPAFIIGIELQRRGCLHMHGLVRWHGPLRDEVSIGTARSDWNNGHGWSKVERPRDACDVNRYVSKYVVKGGELYIEGFRAPSGLSSAA